MNLRIANDRRTAVRSAIALVKNIEQRHGITQGALDLMKPILIDLAGQSHLFPKSDFALAPGYDGVTYRLHEERDHSFGLFASVGRPGKKRNIHNHTTWAVIAGVHGDEHNVVYKRIDDRTDPQTGELAKVDELTVTPDRAIALLPDDFHSIEVLGTETSVHLHLYGMSHAFLPNRIGFPSERGGQVMRYPPSYSVGFIAPADLRSMLDDGGEIAILDVREEGVFSRDGHLLLASNSPLSSLELRILSLVPRKTARVVVCDGNDGLAQIAAARLMKAGYSNVMLLEGGTEAWATDGLRLYTGVHVPCKAFGEYVHHHERTPEVTPSQLSEWKQQSGDLLILDSRPLPEYTRRTIPGSIDCPSAELVYRIHDLIRSPQTRVVVNCGGRTRAIIGAQSLINAGLENPVFALKDGTQGWHLAGFEFDIGRTDHAPLPSEGGLAHALNAAARVAKRFGVQTLEKSELNALLADVDHTVYLIDVRTPEEFEEGHLVGSIHAAGGQLVQATDRYVGLRNATVVLVDDVGVRATMTAAWLLQMGWRKVFVLNHALDDEPLEVGPGATPVVGLEKIRVETVAPKALHALLAKGETQVIDLGTSLDYREGHIPGAWHAVRSRFERDLKKIPSAQPLVLTSPDGVLAKLAVPDARLHTTMPVQILEGGTDAWRAAKLPLERGEARMTGADDDMRYRALDRPTDVDQSVRAYLKWEVDLLQAIESDPDFGFRRFARSG